MLLPHKCYYTKLKFHGYYQTGSMLNCWHYSFWAPMCFNCCLYMKVLLTWHFYDSDGTLWWFVHAVGMVGYHGMGDQVYKNQLMRDLIEDAWWCLKSRFNRQDGRTILVHAEKGNAMSKDGLSIISVLTIDNLGNSLHLWVWWNPVANQKTQTDLLGREMTQSVVILVKNVQQKLQPKAMINW